MDWLVEVVETSKISVIWLKIVSIKEFFALLLLINSRCFAVQLKNKLLTMELEKVKIKYNEFTTISIRFLVQNDNELEAMYNLAPIEEFWFPLSEKAVWTSQAMDVWRELSPFDKSRGESGTILPKFQSIQKEHSSEEWVLADTHNGWEGTTQDFLMYKKGHALTVHAVGAVIELTGQNESPFPTKQHKAKFIRDLLRIHVLRGEKAELYGVITDMCRVVVVRISGPTTTPTIVRTSTADRASQYIGELLKCPVEQLGNACSVFFLLVISFIQ